MKHHRRANAYKREPRHKIISLNLERLHRKDLILVLYDLLAVTAAYSFALWFRFDGNFTEIPEIYLMAWLNFAPQCSRLHRREQN